MPEQSPLPPSESLPQNPPAPSKPEGRRAALPAWIWLLAGLILFGILCGLVGLLLVGSFLLPVSQQQREAAPITPKAQVEPSMTLQAEPEAETSFFRDDFSDPSSGWQRVSEIGGVMDYDGGGYRILVDQPETTYWSTAGLNFSDVVLEVEAEKIAGADDNYFGLICRYQDEENFYIFLVSSDGYYNVGKFKDGQFTSIDEDEQGYSPAIHQGKTVNQLRADCIGSRLTLYANGTRLATVEDNDFMDGDVGLTATTFQIAGTNILFDNFVAQGP